MRNTLKKALVFGTSAAMLFQSGTVFPVWAEESGTEERAEFAVEFEKGEASKPMIRWWWRDGLCDDEEIIRQMADISGAGFGGVEIICKGSSYDGEDGTSWGSDAWLHGMETALTEAKKLGLRVTLTISAGWPAVSPAVEGSDNELAIKKIAYGVSETIPANQTYEGQLPAPEVTYANDTLLAVIAARVDEEAETQEEVQTQYLLDDSFLVLTTEVSQENTIKFTSPEEGQWKIFALYMQNGSEEEYPPVDHFSKEATDALTGYWDSRMITWGDDLNTCVDGLFEDSLELACANLWTPSMLQEFEARRGYDLTPYLPLLFIPSLHFSTGPTGSVDDPADFDTRSALGKKVREDYYQTLTELYAENHVQALSDWCEGHDWVYRAQTAYGAPFELTQSAACADIAETESLYFAKDRNAVSMDTASRDGYRLQSGVVNLTGKDIYSSELSPLTCGAYEQTTKDLLNMANSNMAAGVNLCIVHGYSNSGVYQGKYEGTWGGYDGMEGFFSNSWDRTPDFTQFADSMGYLARNQYVLSQGNQDVDLAYYRLSYYEPQMTGDLVTPELENNGYTYDFVSPYLMSLDNMAVEEQVLAKEGPSYKALIVNGDACVPADACKKILEYADAGLPVVIAGELNFQNTGFADSAEEAEYTELLEKIRDNANIIWTESQEQIVETLKANGIYGDARFESASDLVALHRTEAENDYYYFYNPTDQSVTLSVSLKGSGRPYKLNAWDGSIEAVGLYQETEDGVLLNVTVAPYGSSLYALTENKLLANEISDVHAVESDCEIIYNEDGVLAGVVSDDQKHVVTLSDGTQKEISASEAPGEYAVGPWTLCVENWHPGTDTENQAIIEKTAMDAITLENLVSWQEIEGLEKVSGIGTYEAVVNIENEEWDSMVLNLGTIANSSYRIKINDTLLPPADQFNTSVNIEKYLHQGENKIQVIAASTLLNAGIENGLISIMWQILGFDEPKNQEYGLLGTDGVVSIQENKTVVLE